MYEKLEQFEMAVHDFTDFLEMWPYCAEVLQSRGLCYFELCKEKEALADFNKALTF